MNKIRVPQYDLVRVLAIFLVFCIHSMGIVNEAYEQNQLSTGNIVVYDMSSALVSTAVPLFIMLSGALLLGGTGGVIDFLTKRFRRILIPFFWWSIILFTLSVLKDHRAVKLMLVPDFIDEFVTNGVHGVYWYVYLIIGLYLIAPILRPFFRTATTHELVYVFITSSLFIILEELFPNIKWVKGFHSDYFIHLAYFINGYVIAHCLKNKKYSKPIILMSFIIFFVLSTMNLKVKFTSFPFIYFLSLSLFGMLLFVPVKKSQAILFISKTSYGMYLSHVIFISLLLKLSLANKLPLVIEPIIMASLVMLAECILMWFIEKTKLSKYLN